MSSRKRAPPGRRSGPTPAPGAAAARAPRRHAPVPAAPTSRRPPLAPVARSLSIHLLRSRETVMRYFRPHLRELGLTEQQWRVLRVLKESGPLEAGRLASEAVLLPPSVSRIVRDLTRRGYLVRRMRRRDRRRAELSITPDGTAILLAGAPASAQAYRTIARQFGSQELARLLALLARLERSLAAEPGEDAARDAED